MATQHIVDCLAVINPMRARRGNTTGRLLDVGSGAGLPGVVIAVVLPEVEVLCVDSVGKKAAFITQAAASLDLGNLGARHSRVQELNDAAGFQLITSRAFASLPAFVDATRKVLAPRGHWMAMKGKTPTDDLSQLPTGVDIPRGTNRGARAWRRRDASSGAPIPPQKWAQALPKIKHQHDAHLLYRQSKGWRRQDHDDRQPRRRTRQGRPTSPRRRPRPARQRDDGFGHRQARPGPECLRRPARERDRRRNAAGEPERRLRRRRCQPRAGRRRDRAGRPRTARQATARRTGGHRRGLRLCADRLPAQPQPADPQRPGQCARRDRADAMRVLRARRPLRPGQHDPSRYTRT